MKKLTVLSIITCMVMIICGIDTNAADNMEIIYPPNAPVIASDFGSDIGIDGEKSRSQTHQGIDIKGPAGQQILAVADGRVIDALEDWCWGPTISIDHGRDFEDKKLIAIYGHLGELRVTTGERVVRGQVIAHLGNNYLNHSCIANIRHLHFQLGRKIQTNPSGAWGHRRFLKDGAWGLNPHLYWANGPGKVTCFIPGNPYPSGYITYPVPCEYYQ